MVIILFFGRKSNASVKNITATAKNIIFLDNTKNNTTFCESHTIFKNNNFSNGFSLKEIQPFSTDIVLTDSVGRITFSGLESREASNSFFIVHKLFNRIFLLRCQISLNGSLFFLSCRF